MWLVPVQPVPDLLIRNQLWRTAIVVRQITDVPGIGFLSAFSPTTNGQIPDVFGTLDGAQNIADHADSRTTKLYDRRQQIVLRGDVERIRY
jgi:hypothetical protein